MSARKPVLVGMFVVVATTLAIASAFAQSGPGNPSGGTWLRQTVEEGTSSPTSAPASSSYGTGWGSWFATFSASRSASMVAPRPTETRSILAVARRTVLKR